MCNIIRSGQPKKYSYASSNAKNITLNKVVFSHDCFPFLTKAVRTMA